MRVPCGSIVVGGRSLDRRVGRSERVDSCGLVAELRHLDAEGVGEPDGGQGPMTLSPEPGAFEAAQHRAAAIGEAGEVVTDPRSRMPRISMS